MGRMLIKVGFFLLDFQVHRSTLTQSFYIDTNFSMLHCVLAFVTDALTLMEPHLYNVTVRIGGELLTLFYTMLLYELEVSY